MFGGQAFSVTDSATLMEYWQLVYYVFFLEIVNQSKLYSGHSFVPQCVSEY